VSLTGGRGQLTVELADGVRLILSNPVLRTFLIIGMLISVGFGALDSLGVFFLRRNLHAPAGLFSLLAGAQGVGSWWAR
jgi:Na+/melibiose symporter-like transporter